MSDLKNKNEETTQNRNRPGDTEDKLTVAKVEERMRMKKRE